MIINCCRRRQWGRVYRCETGGTKATFKIPLTDLTAWRCDQIVPRLFLLQMNGVQHGNMHAAGVSSNLWELVLHIMSRDEHLDLCYMCFCGHLQVYIFDFTVAPQSSFTKCRQIWLPATSSSSPKWNQKVLGAVCRYPRWLLQKEMAATFKSDTVFACYRRSLRTFWSHLIYVNYPAIMLWSVTSRDVDLLSPQHQNDLPVCHS